jgi:hypothetical protein
MASKVPLSCDRSIAAVTPVCENKTPTRQVISSCPSFPHVRHFLMSVISQLPSSRGFRHVGLGRRNSIFGSHHAGTKNQTVAQLR